MARISSRIGAIAPSATLAVDAKAKALKAQGRPVIGFGAGEPDFPTPAHIVDAAREALNDPKNFRYSPASGLPELKKAIAEKEIEEASVKVMMGPEKKSHVVTDEERRLTAYHETGHAITGYFSKHHDPVHQISIISRGGAGGYTMYLPEKDPSYVTKTAMFENIVTLLGGRVAEQLVLEDISTGASSDLQRATDTARAMVTRYGFSERMGPVVYGSDPGETFLGRDFGQGKGYSEAIASEIDNEIRDIVDEAYETARRTLTEHMNELHKVAGVLMEREKISGEEFKTLMEGGTLPPYDLGRGETAQPDAPAPDSAAPVQPAEQPETQQPAEPANPQPDTQE